MKYCPYCGQMVQPRKHINWFWLIVLSLLTSGGWLFIYVPYYLLFKSSSCPMCGTEDLQNHM